MPIALHVALKFKREFILGASKTGAKLAERSDWPLKSVKQAWKPHPVPNFWWRFHFSHCFWHPESSWGWYPTFLFFPNPVWTGLTHQKIPTKCKSVEMHTCPCLVHCAKKVRPSGLAYQRINHKKSGWTFKLLWFSPWWSNFSRVLGHDSHVIKF